MCPFLKNIFDLFSLHFFPAFSVVSGTPFWMVDILELFFNFLSFSISNYLLFCTIFWDTSLILCSNISFEKNFHYYVFNFQEYLFVLQIFLFIVVFLSSKTHDHYLLF